MNISVLKIISGTFETKKKTLVLKVECLSGEILKGNYIFLKEAPYRIHCQKIKKVSSVSDGVTEIQVDFPHQSWMWKERVSPYIDKEDRIVFCGLGVEEYVKSDINSKEQYFDTLVNAVGVERVRAFIISKKKWAVKIIPENIEGEKTLSKWGGLPLAPRELDFPKDEKGQSLVFLGQIDISELNKYLYATKVLKGTGVLYFFISFRENEYGCTFGEVRLKYVEEVNEAVEIELPEDLKRFGTLPDSDMMIMDELNIPPYETCLWDFTEMSPEELNAYHYIYAILDEYNLKYFTAYKLLGYPEQIQGCVQLEATLKQEKLAWYSPVNLEEKELLEIIDKMSPLSKDWRLLFEFSGESFTSLSDYDGALNEYVDGTFYVLIRQPDLDNMQFENLVTIYQCT